MTAGAGQFKLAPFLTPTLASRQRPSLPLPDALMAMPRQAMRLGPPVRHPILPIRPLLASSPHVCAHLLLLPLPRGLLLRAPDRRLHLLHLACTSVNWGVAAVSFSTALFAPLREGRGAPLARPRHQSHAREPKPAPNQALIDGLPPRHAPVVLPASSQSSSAIPAFPEAHPSETLAFSSRAPCRSRATRAR